MRYTRRRGFLWLSLYFLLALVPMGIALIGPLPDYRGFLIEFGVALGFIGLAMFGLQFLFSGRLAWIAPTFGMDNIIQYHREMGIIAFIFILAHPIVLIIANHEYLHYFDPSVNFMRAVALAFVTLALIFITATSIWRISFNLDYERWRLIHGLLSLAIVFVGIVHSIQVAHYLNSLGKQVTIAALLGGCMYLVVHTRIVRPWKMRKKPYRVTGVKEELGDCWTITVEPVSSGRMKFIPGQFVWITIGPSPYSLQQHPFSIASSSIDPNISFTAKEVGDFTANWKNVLPGTKVFLEGPFGSFTPEHDKHLFLIMGGIGITPAMSMLRTMCDDGDNRRAILIYANVSWDDATFREELEEMSKLIDLKTIHLLEKPPEGWQGEKGLVNIDLLKKYLPKDKNNYMYFVCGPNPLMDITETALHDLNIDWNKIYTERFEIV